MSGTESVGILGLILSSILTTIPFLPGLRNKNWHLKNPLLFLIRFIIMFFWLFWLFFTIPTDVFIEIVIPCLVLLFLAYKIWSLRKQISQQERNKQKLAEDLQHNLEKQKHSMLLLEKQYEGIVDSFTRKYRDYLRRDPLTTTDLLVKTHLKEVYVPIKIKMRKSLQKTEQQRTTYDNIRGSRFSHRSGYAKQNSNPEPETMYPEEAIESRDRCVLIGDPGSGKTTMLKYLFIQTLEQNIKNKKSSTLPNLPIYIPLHDFVKNYASKHKHENSLQNPDILLTYLAQKQSNDYHLEEAKILTLLKEHLEIGNALVLLDGLDEMFIEEPQNKLHEIASEDPQNRKAEIGFRRAITIIQNFADRYKDSHFVITCRDTIYQKFTFLMTGWQTMELTKFARTDIQLFVTNWLKVSGEPSPEDITKKFLHILEHPATFKEDNHKERKIEAEQLLEVVANPLMLRIALKLYMQGDELYDNKSIKVAQLYSHLVESLLRDWDLDRGIFRLKNFKDSSSRIFLEAIGWHILTKEPSSCTLQELREATKDISEIDIADRKKLQEEGLTVDGLFQKERDNTWSFSHVIWRNYFAAQYAVRVTDPTAHTTTAYKGEVLAQLIRNKDLTYSPTWEEVTLFYCVYTEDITPLLDKLLQEERESIFYPTIFWLGKYALTSITLDSVYNRLRDKVIFTLLPEYVVKTRYSHTRKAVVAILVELANIDASVSPLDLLHIENFQNPVAAIQVIKQLEKLCIKKKVIAKKDLADGFYALLTQHTLKNEVQERILQLLINLEYPPVIFSLLTLVLPQKNVQSHLPIDNTQLHLKIAQVFNKFQYEDTQVFSNFYDEDAQVSDPRPGLERLLPLLTQDKELALYITKILGRLGEPSIAYGLLAQLKLLMEKNILLEVQWGLAIALGLLQNQDDPIIFRIKNIYHSPSITTDRGLRMHLAASLIALGEEAEKDKLLELFRGAPTLLRLKIFEAITELRLKEFIPELLTIISSVSDTTDQDYTSAERFAAIKTLDDLKPDATDVLKLLPVLLSEEGQKQEDLCISILYLLTKQEFTDDQKKQLLDGIKQFQTKNLTENIQSLLLCIRYIHDDSSILPQLLKIVTNLHIYEPIRIYAAKIIKADKDLQHNAASLYKDKVFISQLLNLLFATPDNAVNLTSLSLLFGMQETSIDKYIADLLSPLKQIPLKTDRRYVLTTLIQKLPDYQNNPQCYKSIAKVIANLTLADDEDIIQQLIEQLKELEKHIALNRPVTVDDNLPSLTSTVADILHRTLFKIFYNFKFPPILREITDEKNIDGGEIILPSEYKHAQTEQVDRKMVS